MTTVDVGRGIGIVGGGHMGRALAESLLRSGVDRTTLYLAEGDAKVGKALAADLQITVTNDARTLLPRIDTLVLAVKPQDMAAAIRPLQPELERPRPLVISVAAGLSIAQLQVWCGAAVPVVRAMPNRPALAGAGATGLFAPPGVGDVLRRRAASVLGAAGLVVWVDDEALMDVVTAVSGSGPAYFFLLAEALAAAGTAHGLPRSTAVQLARATLRGAGLMANPESDLANLRESITSKGGTTAAALDSFKAQRFEAMVAAAVSAAVRRGRELSADAEKGG